jgi:hypothetical protein
MKVTWNKQAPGTYFRILDYLEKEWGQKCMKNFVAGIEGTIKIILKKPKIFLAGKKGRFICKGVITKQNI